MTVNSTGSQADDDSSRPVDNQEGSALIVPLHVTSPEEVAGLVTVQQSGKVPVITYADAYAWRCGACGWLGTGLTSTTLAEREGRRHLHTEHGVPLCLPGEHGGEHIWAQVQHTDIEVCTLCGWEIGK